MLSDGPVELKRYKGYYMALLATGAVSEKKALKIATDAEREADLLEAGKCPMCGGPISRKLDARQAGYCAYGGVWYNYRCTCGFMIDRSE